LAYRPAKKSLFNLFRVEINGESNFLKSISVAQLCLKHRVNKHQKQRIVVFVASKVTASEEELEKLAQKLKRNSIAINLVNLCEDTNQEKLEKVGQN
jgi:26S proteasome regulatory subunit N10